MEKKGYIELDKLDNSNSINVSLRKDNVPKSFFYGKIFSKEYENMERFKKIIKRLSTLRLDTMMDRIYKDNGIKTWEF